METNNQTTQTAAQAGAVDYAAALRQYNRYGRGRSIDGCCFGRETLSYILMEKFWYNTPFEQIVRKLKMNLRNAGNIGSESSAADNAFMYSVIESCRHNDIDPGKYISFLLDRLKTTRKGEDLTGLLPCYCGL